MVFIFIYPHPPGLIQKHESIHGLCEVRYSIFMLHCHNYSNSLLHNTLYLASRIFSRRERSEMLLMVWSTSMIAVDWLRIRRFLSSRTAIAHIRL